MLINLHVKNLALIEEADINFEKGLNILTGETGAGKSIIIGSVNLALGSKVNADIIRNGADYALVEAVLFVEDKEKLKRLATLGLEDENDGQIIISRKIMPGKSITKINGETVTQSFVKDITSLLIDIHGQHEHQSLLYPSNYLEILDKYAKDTLSKVLQEVNNCYKEYESLRKEYETFDIDEDKRLRDLSYLEFVVNEIEQSNLKTDEEESLNIEYKRLSNSRKIIDNLSMSMEALGINSNENVSNAISTAIRGISQISSYDDKLENILNSLYDFENVYNDLSSEIIDYSDNFEFSEERFKEIEDRLDIINSLKAKYGNSIDDVLTHLEKCKAELSKMQNFEERKSLVLKELKSKEEELSKLSEELSEGRKKAAAKLEEQIINALVDLNFNDVKFVINFERNDKFTSKGFDNISFLISTNPGEAVRPLEKTASGGELSRIMLALKAVIADNDNIDSLIFDEIDTGISGRTAQKVAEKMSLIAKNRQVICITHLPQIASMADKHFLIEKNVINNKTVTGIEELSNEESVMELARMLGGAKITDAVVDSAKEMKDLAKKAKNN